MNKKLLSIILLVTVLLGAITGCAKEKNVENVNDITIGTLKTLQTIQPFFYEQFSDENEKLDIKIFKNSDEMKTELISGKLDFAILPIETVVIAASEGEDIKIISNINQETINIDDEISLSKNLKDNILEYSSNKKNSSNNKRLNLKAVMVTTNDEIDENPEKVREIVDKNKKSVKYIMENKDEWINKAEELGIEGKNIEKEVENINLYYDITEENVEYIKKIAEIMKDFGMIEKVPNIKNMFDLTFLESSKLKR